MWAALEIILELLAELVLQVIGEVLVELGLERVRRQPGIAHPALAMLGWAALGAVAGGMSVLIVPHRVTSWASSPVWSLILAPLLVGAALHGFGAWRRRRGHTTSQLAMFSGGAACAFGYGLVRYILLAV